jgi:CelD/BcsL family acetyltransferase involved in cellulose biosynthesis
MGSAFLLVPEIPEFEGTHLGQEEDGLELEVIPSTLWEEIFSNWEELLEASVEPTVFLSPFWVASWWHHFREGRQACMLAAWEAGRLCGLAPFYFRRISLPGVKRGASALSFMGDEGVGSEYLGLLVLPGYEEQFLLAVSERVRGQWAVADLHGLREGGSLSLKIAKILGASAPGRVYRERRPCCSILLPGDYESYLASLSQKFRSTIRYRTNKLVKNFRVNLLQTTREEEIDPHLDRFFSMHQARWLAEGNTGSFYSSRKCTFYRDVSVGLLQRGWLRFYHLEVDGVIRASQFGFVFGGVLHSLQDAFDHEFHPRGVGGAGVVLRAMAIKQSILEGLNRYDFLGGTEDFKTRWNTVTRYVQRVRIGAPGLEGAVAFSLPMSILKAKDWAREQGPQWLLNARRQVRSWTRPSHAPNATLGAGEKRA